MLPTGSRRRVARFAWIPLAGVCLAGCGERPQPINPPPLSAARIAALRVVAYSPATTPAGTAFNIQADGASGMSFEVEGRLPSGGVRLLFNGKPLSQVVVRPPIVTGTVPLDYLQVPGTYPLEIEVSGTRIKAGRFVVTPR